MWESYFGFKKTPFSDSPDAKQLFDSGVWNQVKTRLQFLADHHGVGLLTGEVGSGKSTAARAFTATLNPNLYKILYVHFSSACCNWILTRYGSPQPAWRRPRLPSGKKWNSRMSPRLWLVSGSRLAITNSARRSCI